MRNPTERDLMKLLAYTAAATTVIITALVQIEKRYHLFDEDPSAIG